MVEKETKMAMRIRQFPKTGSIGNLVLTTLAKSPTIDYEAMTKLVKTAFPNSKWQASHWAWYKHQVKIGSYTLPTTTPKTSKKAKKNS